MFLHIPTKKELLFKKILKEDVLTMDYNAGYQVDYDGYDYNTGIIKTDIDELKNVWYKKWINNWPSKYYAYITVDDKFIGEIYAKYDDKYLGYEIGIVIKNEYRGKGYSTIAIKLLCDKLKELGAKKIFHILPQSRKSAIKADTNNGFVIKKQNIDGIKKFGKIEKLIYLEKFL